MAELRRRAPNPGLRSGSSRAWVCSLLWCLCSLLWLAPAWAEPLQPERGGEFRLVDAAQRAAKLKILYTERPRTFFCGCAFDNETLILQRPGAAGRGDEADSGSEQADPSCRAAAAQEVVWRPLIPAQQLLAGRACWRAAGTDERCRGLSPQQCCARIDTQARALLGDLQNWVPVRADLAGVGAELAWAAAPDGATLACGLRRNKTSLEPPDRLKGNVARLLLYFERVHGRKLDAAQRTTLRRWHIADAPDQWEATRNHWLGLMQRRALELPVTTVYGHLARLDRYLTQYSNESSETRRRTRLLEKLTAADTKPIVLKIETDDYLTDAMSAVTHALWRTPQADWSSIFELMELHWLATRYSRAHLAIERIGLDGKMFALAVAGGKDDMARWYARDIVRQVEPTDRYPTDRRYYRLLRVMARIVHTGQWPRTADLGTLEEPLRTLFSARTNSRLFMDRLSQTADLMLDLKPVYRPAWHVLPVELVAVIRLRQRHLGLEPPAMEHALLRSAAAAVPKVRPPQAGAVLRAMRARLAKAQPVPALHRAVEEADAKLLQRRLAAGDDVSQRDHLGRTALDIAVRQAWRPGVALLLQSRPPLDGDQALNLHWAVKRGDLALVRQLAEAGIDLHHKTRREQKAVYLALEPRTFSYDIHRYLMTHGAAPRGAREWAWLLDTVAQHAHRLEFRPLVELYLQLGANLSSANMACYGIEAGIHRHIDFLVAKGWDINRVNWRGNTALHCAVDYGVRPLVETLLRHDPDLRIKNKRGATAADVARGRGERELAQRLQAPKAGP